MGKEEETARSLYINMMCLSGKQLEKGNYFAFRRHFFVNEAPRMPLMKKGTQPIGLI